MEHNTTESKKQVEREIRASRANDIVQECAGAADGMVNLFYRDVFGDETAEALRLARVILESIATLAQKAAAVAAAEANAIPESYGNLKWHANISKDAAIRVAAQCAEELEEFNHEYHE